jgi:hypothetical protein
LIEARVWLRPYLVILVRRRDGQHGHRHTGGLARGPETGGRAHGLSSSDDAEGLDDSRVCACTGLQRTKTAAYPVHGSIFANTRRARTPAANWSGTRRRSARPTTERCTRGPRRMLHVASDHPLTLRYGAAHSNVSASFVFALGPGVRRPQHNRKCRGLHRAGGV